MTNRIRTVNRITSSTTFGDIKVPDELRRVIKTGWTQIDSLFTGEGIRPGTCCLLTGLPGAGKTTMSLQLADSLAGLGNGVVVNGCEESVEQIKMNIEKMGLRSINKVHPSNEYEVGAILRHCDAVKRTKRLDKTQGMFLVVDSLQTIEKARRTGARGRPMAEAKQRVEAVWDIANWCKATYNVAFIIGQVTKDGEFEGRNEIKHAVDCHWHADIDTARDSEFKGERFMSLTKNRTGASGVPYYYNTSSRGISFNA